MQQMTLQQKALQSLTLVLVLLASTGCAGLSGWYWETLDPSQPTPKTTNTLTTTTQLTGDWEIELHGCRYTFARNIAGNRYARRVPCTCTPAAPCDAQGGLLDLLADAIEHGEAATGVLDVDPSAPVGALVVDPSGTLTVNGVTMTGDAQVNGDMQVTGALSSASLSTGDLGAGRITAPDISTNDLTADFVELDTLQAGGIGIGTSTPAAPLHIDRAGGFQEIARFENDDGAFLFFDNTTSTDQGSGVGHVGDWQLGTFPDGRFFVTVPDSGVPELEIQPDGAATFRGTVTAAGVLLSSDRAKKRDLEPTPPVLAALRELKVLRWRFGDEPPAVRHLGPTAQDFAAAFGLGDDVRHIHVTDALGVALAAVQELAAEVEALRAEIEQGGTR